MSAFQHLQGDEPGIGRALPPLYNLVYCSRATAGVDDAAVQRIVGTARRQNAIHGITGLLVFGSGIFFQWLEGPRESIQTLLALLHADPRHRDIVVLGETEEVRDRLFPDWDMERVTAEHIRDVLQDAMDNATDENQAQTLEQLLAQMDGGLLSELARG